MLISWRHFHRTRYLGCKVQNIVDEDNNEVGKATRAEMRAGNLIHRCSYAIVENAKKDIYVQKRVAFKETYPSYYDPAPGGVVGFGESYRDNAVRELEEEMGIKNAVLEELFDFWCQYDGPFVLDPEEVESGSFMSLQDIVRLLNESPVCPDSAEGLRKYLQEYHSKSL